MLGAPGMRVGENLLQGRLGVDGPGVDIEHRLRPREPPGTRGMPQLLAHEVEQVGRVAGVEDAEA